MNITSDTSGLASLIARVQEARAVLPELLVDAAQSAGDAVVGELHDAAPVGQGGSIPPPGDASGPLAESFYAVAERQADAGVVEVRANQPIKLSYVVNGRGWVYPVNKKALYWEGLDHPVARSRPSNPNDFVSPVLADATDTVEGEAQTVVEELQAILEGE